MKRVRRLAAEPPQLAAYRLAYPNEETRPSSEANASWERFKSEQGAYAELLAELLQAQQGLCIYCEQRLVDGQGKLVALDYQVEHVQAKSAAVGRVLAWENLALACGGGTYPHHPDPSRRHTTTGNHSCGQAKGDGTLPPGCDPRDFPLLNALVDIGLDGNLTANGPNCQAAGVTEKDLQAAIELLKLNGERLRHTRQTWRDNVNAWLVPMLGALLQGAHLGPGQRQEMLDLLIAGRLQPDAGGHLRAWWSTERSALGPDAEGWISQNQGLF